MYSWNGGSQEHGTFIEGLEIVMLCDFFTYYAFAASVPAEAFHGSNPLAVEFSAFSVLASLR